VAAIGREKSLAQLSFGAFRRKMEVFWTSVAII